MDELTKMMAFLLTLCALLPHISSEIPRQEIDSATSALRSRGYNLFGNSLTVSDLLFEVLSGKEFTLLAPPDTSLFSLAMSTDSFRYVNSLRLHLIPRRLSLTDLRNLSLSQTPSLDSLIPTHSIFLSNRRTDFDVLVNGLRISSPDIYLGSHIAVHGLDGTLAADMLPPQTDLGLGYASGPIQDSVPPLIQPFSPHLAPPIPVPARVPSSSPHLAPGSEIPSPRHHQRGTGRQVGSGFRPNNPSPKSSPSVKTFPPRHPPVSTPPPIWGSPPTQPKVWKPKKSHESTEHKKSNKKRKCRKHHHRHHKGL